MKVNSLYHFTIIFIILIISLSSQIHVYADSTNPMTSSFNHTLALERQLSRYFLNDTQTVIAINLAKNSTQFQSLVKGYNYTFNSINDVVRPAGGYVLRGYDVFFDFYKGPIIPCRSAGGIDVFENPALTNIFNITTHGPLGCIPGVGGYIALNHTVVPEFPFAIPILVISFASLLIFYRIKFKF